MIRRLSYAALTCLEFESSDICQYGDSMLYTLCREFDPQKNSADHRLYVRLGRTILYLFLVCS